MAVPSHSAVTRIPLLDLTAQHRALQSELDQAIHAVFTRGQFILGPDVEALEQEVAAYCGVRHAVGVASGTGALELSLRACTIGPGDEVITAAFSFFATAEAIVAVGATPVFADIDPRTFTLDLEHAAACVTPRTKAVIPVHLYGHPCDMDAVRALADRRGLAVIEDCAQAIGAAWKGKRVGGLGAAGAFSFFPSKNLGGCGDGGMVVTDDAALAERVRLLRTHGSRERYWHVALGTNSRLDELQAAILRVKLRRLDDWNAARRRHAQAYTQRFAQAGAAVTVPTERPGATHVYHAYTLRLARRDRVRAALDAHGIASQVYYPSTLPAQPALAGCAAGGPWPQAEAACREVLSLPIFPELLDAQRDAVAAAVEAAA